MNINFIGTTILSVDNNKLCLFVYLLCDIVTIVKNLKVTNDQLVISYNKLILKLSCL